MTHLDETFTTATFEKLLAPKANPRKTFEDIEGLAASIKTDGLLQNLVVRQERKGYRITAGERRYRALKLLIDAGDLPADYAVKIVIRTNKGADADRLALIENIQRRQLEPIDEAEAFTQLLSDKMNIDDIAEQVGVSTMTVRRRLSLASLCDEAKEAVRAGNVSLSEAQALTLGSHDQQRQLLERVGGYFFNANAIRDALTRKPSRDMAIFDPDLYTGTYTRDLFADDSATYFDDADQFAALQAAAFEAKAEQFRGEGREVVIVEAGDYNTWHQFYDGGKKTSKIVLMQIDGLGKVRILENMVRQERGRASLANDSSGEVKEKPEHSAAFLDLIGAIRSTAVMEAIIANPRKVMEIAVYQIITNYQHRANGVEQHRAIGELRLKDPEHPALVSLDKAAEHHLQPFIEQGVTSFGYDDRRIEGLIHLRSDRSSSGDTLYGVIRSLDDTELANLHALLVAVTFGHTAAGALDTAQNAFNTVAQDLAVNVRQGWQPGAAFLKGYRADRLKEIAVECGFAAQRSVVESHRKGDLVKMLTEWFREAAEAAEPTDRQRQANEWTDKALQFPAAAPGEALPSSDIPTEDAADDDLSEAA